MLFIVVLGVWGYGGAALCLLGLFVFFGFSVLEVGWFCWACVFLDGECGLGVNVWLEAVVEYGVC